jgi:hypothetical protein
MPTTWPARSAVKLIFLAAQTDAAAIVDDNHCVVKGTIDIGRLSIRMCFRREFLCSPQQLCRFAGSLSLGTNDTLLVQPKINVTNAPITGAAPVNMPGKH